MKNFFVRVELHEAPNALLMGALTALGGGMYDPPTKVAPGEPVYETLHSEMTTRGFSRLIWDIQQRGYHLPTAEYLYETSSETIDDNYVLNLAKEAAAKAWGWGNFSAIVMTVAQPIRFYNLKPTPTLFGSLMWPDKKPLM